MAGHSAPIGGLAYYISPPQSTIDIIRNPIHTLIYTTFVLASFALFSRIWIEISGSSSKDIAR
jgi:protein transport protein SEC61 subunit alpha